MTDDDVERLMQDTGIVRNRAKILATRKNGAADDRLRDDGGLEAFVESFRPRADAGAAHARRGADDVTPSRWRCRRRCASEASASSDRPRCTR